MFQRFFGSSDQQASSSTLPNTIYRASNPLTPEHPDHFLCSISLDLMTNPVVICTGHTFERENIEAWFNAGHNTNPYTGEPLPNRDLVPNLALKAAIETYRATLNQPVVSPVTLEEEAHQLIFQTAQQFVQELEAHLTTSGIQEELNLEENAAKAYVATVFGLIRKRELGFILLPNTEETCCLPARLTGSTGFITNFVMSHGVLMLAQQYPDFCKSEIEVRLNRGEELTNSTNTGIRPRNPGR